MLIFLSLFIISAVILSVKLGFRILFSGMRLAGKLLFLPLRILLSVISVCVILTLAAVFFFIVI